MKHFQAFRRSLAWLTAAALGAAMLGNLPQQKKQETTLIAAAAETGSRIRVDINKNDGRKASYTKTANNWLVDNSYTYAVNGVTCKLSVGGTGSVDLVNCKVLQLQDVANTPTLTMDGAKVKDGDGSSTLKLELTGLSAGTHSLTTWHSCPDNVENSSMTVKINGATVASGVKCPTRVKDSNDAGMAYGTFNVSAGQTVTVEIKADGNGTQNTPWLNAFEIDGADPFNSISRIVPADQEAHLEASQGLSWQAGTNAVSHHVYIGTDFQSVSKATTSSPEFKGTVTDSHFALDDSYSSIPTYYWRVDEVNKDGSIVPGAVYSFHVTRLAFPTAEGYGRFARGGRGGYVYHVTNLNDSGEGSLRYGLETLKGARTVVFDVGGVIELKSALVIPEDGGDVYVAGQTAPGDGITLINYDFGGMGTSDAIIRNVRTRVGDRNDTATGGMGLGSCNHCIIDHCSISWATDEGFSSRSAGNITFQWNIIGESLNNSVHYDANDRNKTERHAFAASIGGFTGSFHHNLLINNTGRNWSLAGAMEQDAVTYGGQLDISNNVIYNWKDRTTDGGVRRLNFVNNYYKAGPVSDTNLHIVAIDGNELNTSDMQMAYVSGNIMAKSDGSYILKPTDNAWDKGKAKSGGKNSTNSDVRSDSPFFENHITLQSAEDAYKAVVDNVTGAGANIPQLDYIDSRYHNEVQKGTYTYTGSKDGLKGIIDSQNDVGGYPGSSNFKGGTAPADTDKDGMPDAWEQEHGLNPNDAADGSVVSLSADDYTNLELYLNELAGDPVAFNGNVKTIDAFSQIEAESFDSQEGVKTQECSDENGGEQVAYIENGDYLMFRNVDFADGAKSFTARLAGNTAAIELYLDKLGDTPDAVLDFSGTGNWTDWETVSCSIRKITGKHNVYVRFTGGDGYLVNMNWFTFGKNTVTLNGKYVSSLTISDEANAASWKLSGAPAVGSLLFGDRPSVSYTTVPKGLDNAETILTACDSKNTTDPTDMAVFTAKEDVTVYIGLDSRVEKVPSWMGDYVKTDLTSTSSNDVTFVLYSKDFTAGETVTLGSNEQSYQCMNYVVYVNAKTTAPEPTTEPTETEQPTSDTSDATMTDPSETGTTLYGDTDCDGDVDIMDVILLNRNLMIGAEISDQGLLNVDVDNSGKIDAVDSLNILKAVVQLITLPVL